MIISRTFVLPAIILIAAFNSIHGNNPNIDSSAIETDEITTMFQNIKDNVSDIKNKTLLILKCISDSNLNKGLNKNFFKSSMENYTQLDLHNDHNSPSISIDLNDEDVSELKKTVGELYQKIRKQRKEFADCSSVFLNSGIQIDQTDQYIMANSIALFQLHMDCNNYEKHLSKKNLKNKNETELNG